jgi:hypothetical protein
MMVTNPMTDFAYLLSTNIDVAIRRVYRLSLLGISAIPVLWGAGIDINNKRSMALFEAVSSRLFQTVEDWDALKVIS